MLSEAAGGSSKSAAIAVLGQRAARHLPVLSRYAVASVFSLTLDLITLMMLRGIGLTALAAGAGGYAAGLALQFVLAQRIVFRDVQTGKTGGRLFAEFAASGLLGLAITATILHLATDLAGLPALVGKLFAVVVSFVTVFVLRNGVVFKSKAAA
jgi:putative flippase GtrA